jgi:hypothetical protein
MRLDKNDGKMGVALAVLRHVKVRRNSVGVQAYSNCREQGLHLNMCFVKGIKFGKERAVSFAENRNSDDIVVLYGAKDQFDDHGLLIGDDVWRKQRKFFGYGEHEKAGKFITKWLLRVR